MLPVELVFITLFKVLFHRANYDLRSVLLCFLQFFIMSSIQERQLVLSESMEKKLEAILGKQEELGAQNEELRRQNSVLMEALERERQRDPEPIRGRSRGRKAKTVVPELLRVSILLD